MLPNNVSSKVGSEQLLCANLYIAVDENSHDICLTLIDCESGHSEIVNCRNVFSYRILRDPHHDEPPYFIGSVRIERAETRRIVHDLGWEFAAETLPDAAWVIELHGDIDLHVVCLDIAPHSADLLNHFSAGS